MSHIYSSLHLAISKKLGWDDMLASVALPAIDKIVNTFIGYVSDATGDVMRYQDAVNVLLEYWPANEIFGLLIPDDYMAVASSEPLDMFISLRGEIEKGMRRGMSYSESISEWYNNN